MYSYMGRCRGFRIRRKGRWKRGALTGEETKKRKIGDKIIEESKPEKMEIKSLIFVVPSIML